MHEEQYLETIIDYKILDDIKKETKCTKYVNQYSTEYRIAIYLLRTNHALSYRQIIKYCEYKYDISPSLGHIKQLILDGKEELSFRANIKKESSGEGPHNKNIQVEKPINIKCELSIQSSENEKERKSKRISDLKSKIKNNDVVTLTLEERRELWDLTTVGPATAEYYM